MIDKDIILRQIDEMPVEQILDLILKALDDSGIEYATDGAGIPLEEWWFGETIAEGRYACDNDKHTLDSAL